MKIVVVGHGMVGHKFLEELQQHQIPGAEVTVLCEEARTAYDRVHLSEFFSGKTADDLSLRLALKYMLQGTEQQEERGQPLLAIDDFVMALLVCR